MEEKDKVRIVEDDQLPSESEGFADLLGSLVKLGNAVLDRMDAEDRERLAADVLKAFGVEEDKEDPDGRRPRHEMREMRVS